MKTILAIIILSVSARSCDNSNDDSPLVKGKLIHRSCASVVVQVLDPKYYHLGQNDWTPLGTDKHISHVFAVANICSFPEMNVDKQFTFKVLKEDPSNKDCAVCELWDGPPEKTQLIKVVDTP